MNKRLWVRGVARWICFSVAVVLMHGTSNAGLVFSTQNHQYTNVNINAETTALAIQGEVGNTGIQVTFNGYGVGPGFTPLSIHGQHGVAFIEPASTPPDMYRLTITAQSGWGFSAMDWKLDAGANGNVTFTGLDSNNNSIPLTSGTNTFAFSATGANPFNVVADGGSLISTLVVESTVPITHIQQVSVNITAVPEPSSVVTFGILAIAAYFPIRRRYARKSLLSKQGDNAAPCQG